MLRPCKNSLYRATGSYHTEHLKHEDWIGPTIMPATAGKHAECIAVKQGHRRSDSKKTRDVSHNEASGRCTSSRGI